ncbi:hypothetical protein BDW72DRAFT_194674 [Aspergillus terricola var. indicus]
MAPTAKMSTVDKSSRETWTSEEDQQLVGLRYQYWQLTWDRFTQSHSTRVYPAILSETKPCRRYLEMEHADEERRPAVVFDWPSSQTEAEGPAFTERLQGRLRFVSQRSAMDSRPRQVNDTTEDDDDCSWNSSESDEGELAQE